MLAISSAPIFVGILSFFILNEKPSVKWYLATFFAVIGCILINANLNIDFIGILCSLGAGLSYASYTLFSKKLLERHTSLEVVAVVFSILPMSTAVTLTLAEPLTATILGVVLVGEKLSFLSSMGIAFMIIGICIFSIKNESTVLNREKTI